ncbi:hypothetical protein MANES_16G053115v8 [Manihot esculenta]|uniref:Uncharacterized protein n=1 Tax=Manihot esculenta TaxID=3983 RepID=A0ACB7G6V8_MANES|nr:hypothetical protein MANES_16G053115v8 [Manihot esculenta]
MESPIYQYELFKMKSDETISQMYDRFIEIIGGMKSLGKTFTNEELREQVEEPSKMKKNIALRVASEDTSEEEEEISEEELALVTRRIRKLLLQNKKFIPRKNFRKEKGESSKKEVVICYECNKPGHYKVDCPKLKKPIKKFKKKAFKATWDESSDTKEEDVGDEVANMCFMALEESSNEVIILDDSTLCDDVVEFSYDELVGALKLMNDELEKSHKKNKILKYELASLKRESENSPKEPLPSSDPLQKSLDKLSLENKNLKNEILELKNSLSKFLKGKDKLDEILDSQRSPSIKYGLGYDKSTQANSSKTVFVKATNSNEPKVSSSNGNMPKVCLKSSKIESKWYLDSGCSRHMTGNSSHFISSGITISLEKKDGSGQVTFGDNGKDKIVGIGKEVSCDDDLVGNLDELTIEDPQPHGDQSQPKEDSIEAIEDESRSPT